MTGPSRAARAAYAPGFLVTLCAALMLALAGCGKPYQKPGSHTYTVRAGDTLYSIAWRNGVDYRDLARWNKLPGDYRIYPGQVLRLTGPGGASPPAAHAPRATAPTGKPPAPPAQDDVAVWVWPTEGQIAAVSHTATDSQGLTISGQEGQLVRATAAGRVVYTGSGLRGFGNLLIIKHSNVFLSAYGHNRDLKVKEGDPVQAGQPVAEMGLGPGQKPMLYFEIRYNGQPVDPRWYLPVRPGVDGH
ncbi:MAG TPA: peptidoglycan DD-metalloendopeptidase family protein [Steroidobacteraceae bacterium]|nr:peptidoglycan DD-metalloendopeptidase family protein [Steroidobacteraceae bacterium]